MRQQNTGVDFHGLRLARQAEKERRQARLLAKIQAACRDRLRANIAKGKGKQS